MKKKCVLSIVLPTYNDVRVFDRLEFLQDAEFCRVNGVEVIVSDDSTNDSIYKRVRGISHYKYFRHRPTGNPVDNWNYGLDMASSHYTWLLHHDEFIYGKNELKKILDNLRASRIELLFLRLHLLRRGKVKPFKPQIIQKIVLRFPRLLYAANFLGSPSVVIHKQNSLRYDRRLKWLVDVDYFVRALSKYRVAALIDIPIVSDLDTNGGISSTICNKKNVHRNELKLLPLKSFEYYAVSALLFFRYLK